MTNQVIMTPVKIKETGMVIFIHEGINPKMGYNNGRLVVSKQPNSNSTFCIDPNKIEKI